jgi:hypothetical protein
MVTGAMPQAYARIRGLAPGQKSRFSPRKIGVLPGSGARTGDFVATGCRGSALRSFQPFGEWLTGAKRRRFVNRPSGRRRAVTSGRPSEEGGARMFNPRARRADRPLWAASSSLEAARYLSGRVSSRCVSRQVPPRAAKSRRTSSFGRFLTVQTVLMTPALAPPAAYTAPKLSRLGSFLELTQGPHHGRLPDGIGLALRTSA